MTKKIALVLIPLLIILGCAGSIHIEPTDTPLQKAEKIYKIAELNYTAAKTAAEAFHVILPISDEDWAKILTYEAAIDKGFPLAKDALEIWKTTGADTKDFYAIMQAIMKAITDIQDLYGNNAVTGFQKMSAASKKQ